MTRRRTFRLLTALTLLAVTAAALVSYQYSQHAESRVRSILPGRLIRGAWQPPAALASILKREQIRTVVTLTAINTNDPKYVAQKPIVDAAHVRWLLIPMRGSTATLDQMAQAADLLADPANQPVFFHCVGGHHRTSLAHAAYLIRHQGKSADQAWAEIQSLPWTRPSAPRDQQDQALIRAFAARESARRLALKSEPSQP